VKHPLLRTEYAATSVFIPNKTKGTLKYDCCCQTATAFDTLQVVANLIVRVLDTGGSLSMQENLYLPEPYTAGKTINRT
jgi:hypothetical protein